jgi:two-component system, chemotaxis family, protein-glutamate methylesterase/glutaminase
MAGPIDDATRPQWLVAIAASAGGIPAIQIVLSGLPSQIPAVVLVLQHMERTRATTHLAEIFSRSTSMKVTEAIEGHDIESGQVYVAAPNRHMVLRTKWKLGLDLSPLVHFLRPSADVLFPSVASRYGKRAIAVVLTGTGRDGARGASIIHNAGGIVIAQDEETSTSFGMPRETIKSGQADFVLPIHLIASKITQLVNG